MTITVYGGPLSPFVRKVLIVLEHKGIEYDLVPVSPFPPSEELLAVNPKGQIPALTDGDLALGDSSVICEYLEDAYPEMPLRPNDIRDRAKARWIEDFCDTTLSAGVGRPLFFQKIVRGLLMKQEPDEAVMREAFEELLPKAFAWLEAQTPTEGYLVGQQFSLADVALGSQLHNLDTVEYKLDARRWPNLAAYSERIAAEPAFQRRRAHDEAILRKLRG